MKIYIAGPITGIKNYQTAFQKAEASIRSKGQEPINPCRLDAIFSPETTSWEEYLLASLGLLRACSAILLLPGWERSRGARREYREALKLRLAVYKDVDAVKEVREDG